MAGEPGPATRGDGSNQAWRQRWGSLVRCTAGRPCAPGWARACCRIRVHGGVGSSQECCTEGGSFWAGSTSFSCHVFEGSGRFAQQRFALLAVRKRGGRPALAALAVITTRHGPSGATRLLPPGQPPRLARPFSGSRYEFILGRFAPNAPSVRLRGNFGGNWSSEKPGG